MTNKPNSTRARAEAAFRKVSKPATSEVGDKKMGITEDDKPASQSRPVETTEGAMDEYKARQDAQRANMAKLRTQRLAKEAKDKTKPMMVKRRECPRFC